MKLKDVLSDSLRKAIRESELPLQAIEKATGVDRNSLARFLDGRTSLRLNKAGVLANFFGLDLANLRKLRLLFEDFPKNHNLILIGQPSLLATLDLGVNQDIKSRITYSVITKRLNADDLRDFLLRELDRVGLGHNTFTRAALDLIVRSADGVLARPATWPSPA